MITPKPPVPLSKPPLGVKPKWLHQELIDNIRKKELSEAIHRYLGAPQNLCIPVEWVEEYNEIIERQKNRK